MDLTVPGTIHLQCKPTTGSLPHLAGHVAQRSERTRTTGYACQLALFQMLQTNSVTPANRNLPKPREPTSA
jgi:hypothetical protein